MRPEDQPLPMVHAMKDAKPANMATLTALFQPSAPMTIAGEKPAITIKSTEMTMFFVLANLGGVVVGDGDVIAQSEQTQA